MLGVRGSYKESNIMRGGSSAPLDSRRKSDIASGKMREVGEEIFLSFIYEKTGKREKAELIDSRFELQRLRQ